MNSELFKFSFWTKQPQQIKHATSANFYEDHTYLPNSNELSPGSKLANQQECIITDTIQFDIKNHPYLLSSPETFEITLKQVSGSLGIHIRHCEYHNMPYIDFITSDSPLRRSIPSKYRNNTWILAIGNREPSSTTTTLKLLQQRMNKTFFLLYLKVIIYIITIVD